MVNTASDDFAAFLQQREAASAAFVNGDVAPLDGIATHMSPATIFGPNGTCIQGSAQVNAVNARGAALFRPGSTNAFEIMHTGADQHLAYWVGIQRSIKRLLRYCTDARTRPGHAHGSARYRDLPA
jgi:hypothetical protein